MKRDTLLQNGIFTSLQMRSWQWVCIAVSVLLVQALYTASTLAGAQSKICVKVTASASPEITGPNITFADKTIPLDDSGKGVEVTMDKAYTLSLQGSFDNPPQSASATIRAKIETCYDVLVDGERHSGGYTITRLFSSQGSDDPASYQIKIVLPEGSTGTDFGAGGAGSNSCGCPINCDDQSGGGGDGSEPPQPPGTDPEVNFEAGMGRDSDGTPVGTIRFNQQLSMGTVNRHNFEFLPISTVGESISDGGGLRQVYGPEGLADIVELPNGSIEVRYYLIANVGPKDGNGLYTVTGQPSVVHRLTPGNDPAVGNGIVYTVTRNGQTSTEAFYGSGGVNGGIARDVHADGRITETTTVVTVDPLDSSIWTRVVVVRELVDDNGNEVELSVRREEHASRAWGEVLERSIEDPNGANLVTEYAYYENEQNDGAAYKKRKHMVQPNGGWEKYVYNSRGGVEKTYRPWKDLPSSPNNATDNNCSYRLTLFDSDGQPNGSQEFVLGVQTKRTQIYEVSWDAEYDGSQFRDLITTETQTYHANDWTGLSASNSYLRDNSGSTPRKGTLYRTTAPNKTATRFLQTKGDFNESTGVFSANSAGAFTRSTTTQGTSSSVAGIANRTTRTVTISDHKGPRRSETQVYTGAAYETVETTTYQYETGSGRRLLSTAKDGAVVSSTLYTSDLETTETDATGIVTTQTTDASGRLIQSVKAGVAAGGSYEAQTAITTASTEEGLTSITTVSSGGLSLSSSRTNDRAGRLVSQTDEQDRTTTYGYTSGGRVVTETGPGGVTRITTQYLDGQIKSITGTGVIAEFHDYEVDGSANLVHTVYYGTGDNTSPRWRKTVTNGLDQVIREETPGPNGPALVSEHSYNDKGLRIKTTRTGFADTLYEYDSLGRPTRQGLDLDGSGLLDLASAEPITESDRSYEKDANDAWWEVVRSARYLADGNDGDVAATTTKSKLGIGAGSTIESTTPDGNSTLSVATVDRPNKTVTAMTTSSLSNLTATQIQVNGLLVSRSTLTVTTPSLMRYDALGRQTAQIDPRTNEPSTTGYDAPGRISSVSDGAGNTTTFTYYGNTHANAGLLATQTNQEGETTRYAYDSLGRITHQWGNATYPLAYSYNAYGDRTQLRTFQAAGDWNNASLPASFSSVPPSLTTWSFHAGSGSQTSKTDAASEAVTYTYHPSGLLATRTWARGSTTSYNYDTAGRVTGVDYSDSTPDVTITYRRDGQRLTNSDAAGSHAYTYHPGTGAAATETITGGLLSGLSLTWNVDGSKRASGYSAALNGTSLNNAAYGYDATSRLNSVTSGTRSAEYSYVNNSDLLYSTTLKNNGTTRLVGSRVFDDANRLGSITWNNGAPTAVSAHAYTYDGANRRLRADLADGSFWEYSYNDKGEVTAAVKKSAGGAVYPGLNHGYAFDEIGNRVTATVDAEGGGSRTTGYTANALNQYSSVTHPSAFDVIGSAADAAIVTVNTLPAQRLGPHFRKQLPANNNAQPAWTPVEVVAVLPGAGTDGKDVVTTRNGHRYTAPLPESPNHDEDGNLTGDGRWIYTWDAENRLIAMQTTAQAITAGDPKRRLAFSYDGGGRRIRKQVYDWDAGTSSWTLQSVRRFIYDQWNLLAEVDEAGTLLKSYVWGLDASRELYTAGGIGGLLWGNDVTTNQTQFVAYDGNDNVTALTDAATGTLTARYEYNAFGETVLIEGGDVAHQWPFQFSTRYCDEESGIIYYGRRYYDSSTGRWLSNDPLEETGGFNLYGFCLNNALNLIDPFGTKAEVQMAIAPAGKKYQTVTVFINVSIYWRCSPNDASGKPVLSLQQQQQLTAGILKRWNYVSRRTDPNGAKIEYHVETSVNAKYQLAGDKEEAPHKENVIIIDTQTGRSFVRTYGKLGTGRTEMTFKKPWPQNTFNHEMGHVFGHRDMYIDNGQGKTFPKKNWYGNLMAGGTPGNIVDWKNAEEILHAFGFDAPNIQEYIEP